MPPSISAALLFLPKSPVVTKLERLVQHALVVPAVVHISRRNPIRESVRWDEILAPNPPPVDAQIGSRGVDHALEHPVVHLGAGATTHALLILVGEHTVYVGLDAPNRVRVITLRRVDREPLARRGRVPPGDDAIPPRQPRRGPGPRGRRHPGPVGRGRGVGLGSQGIFHTSQPCSNCHGSGAASVHTKLDGATTTDALAGRSSLRNANGSALRGCSAPSGPTSPALPERYSPAAQSTIKIVRFADSFPSFRTIRPRLEQRSVLALKGRAFSRAGISP